MFLILINKSSHFKQVVFKILLLTLVGQTVSASVKDDNFPKGVVIDTVSCRANPKYSYALYLPTSYEETRSFPVIFAFDPMANGKAEADLFKEAAEKYGYILVCSNNSKNGIGENNGLAAEFTVNDALERFRIDLKRIYTAGFSGGSRVAAMVALKTQVVAGIIGYGAGFPSKDSYTDSDIRGFDYIGLIGKRDFNYPEMLELEKKLEKSDLNVRLMVSGLRHQYPLKNSIFDAIEWMELNAIKKGLLPKNEVFIHELFLKRTDTINLLERNGDILETASNLKYLVNDFKGLVDITIFQAKLDSLLKTEEYAENIQELNATLQNEIGKIQKLYLASDQVRWQKSFQDSLYTSWMDETRYYSKLSKKVDKYKQNMAYRILGDIYMIMYEIGDEFYETKNYSAAINCYKVCVGAMPENWYANYKLACSFALNRNHKSSLKSIERLIELGTKKRKFFDSEPAFARLKDDKRFIELMNSLE